MNLTPLQRKIYDHRIFEYQKKISKNFYGIAHKKSIEIVERKKEEIIKEVQNLSPEEQQKISKEIDHSKEQEKLQRRERNEERESRFEEEPNQASDDHSLEHRVEIRVDENILLNENFSLEPEPFIGIVCFIVIVFLTYFKFFKKLT